MKSILNGIVLNSILSSGLLLNNSRRNRYPQFGSRPARGPKVAQQVQRSSLRYPRGPRRRFGRNDNNGHLEINRAEGGFKNLNQGGSYKIQSVDVFRKVFLDDQGRYLIDDSSLVETVDLNTMLRNSNEFITAVVLCYKYRISGVRISFDYSLVPPSGMTLTKLIMNMETDLVKVEDPRINKNAMQLSMSRQGVKNFWFNINKGNTKEDNLDWIPSSEDPNLTLKLTLSSQGENVNPANDLLYLGVMKFSFIIHLMMADIQSVSTALSKRGFKIVRVPNLDPEESNLLDASPGVPSVSVKPEVSNLSLSHESGQGGS